jgi:hypothetical protein
VEEPAGKKVFAKYREKAAYTYQSYHSTMLPTEPLKIDLIRLAVVLSLAGAAADPRGRALELSIEGSFI